MKQLRALILGLSLISVTFHSSESKAAIGLVAAPALISAGVVMTGLGVGSGVLIAANSAGDQIGISAAVLFVVSLPLAALGLVLLDGEQTMEFAPLSNSQAAKLQISPSELSAYNNEVDQLNNLASFVEHEVARDGLSSAEEARDVWNEVKGSVSPEAFNAFVKVNKQMVKIK